MGEMTYSAGHDQDCWHDENGRFSFPKSQKLYGQAWSLVATDLAEDYHSNHDGWEAHWPLQIRIYDDGVEVARFSVERENEPVFYAWEIETPPGQEHEGEASAQSESPQTTAQQ
jgi:hypothetical protein